MDKPRYDEAVRGCDDMVLEAINAISKGDDGCVARASVAMGQALERLRSLRSQLWADFSATDEARTDNTPHKDET